VSAIKQFEAGGLEEHAAHFSAMVSVAASDAEESVIAELFTQERLHGGQAFLGAEQMGIEGANPLHDQLAPEVPDIQPVEDSADAEVEGHHTQLARGSGLRRRGCGDRRFVTSTPAQQEEREAGKCDSPNQRNGAHHLFSCTSARCALNHSPVG
jgi:hypothetical protein